MSRSKPAIKLPAGSAAAFALQIALARDECRRAADLLARRNVLGESELEECVRLSDSLAATQQYLKTAVAQIVISRRRREIADPTAGP